jgi:hypothetical protein
MGPGGYGIRNARNAASVQLTGNFIPVDTIWWSNPQEYRMLCLKLLSHAAGCPNSTP